MKKTLYLACLCASLLFAKDSNDVVYYSLLLEEDGRSFMILMQRESGKVNGQVNIVGGYKYFKEVYKRGDYLNVRTYIQPASLSSKGSNLSAYTKTSYEIDKFKFSFFEKNKIQTLDFESEEAITKIKSFLSLNQSFTLASVREGFLNAGRYYPVLSANTLKSFINKNPYVYCKMLSLDVIKNKINFEIDKKLQEALPEFQCDEFFNLKRDETSQKKETFVPLSKDFTTSFNASAGLECFYNQKDKTIFYLLDFQSNKSEKDRKQKGLFKKLELRSNANWSFVSDFFYDDEFIYLDGEQISRRTLKSTSESSESLEWYEFWKESSNVICEAEQPNALEKNAIESVENLKKQLEEINRI